MDASKITVKIETEIIAEYENYIVLALYMDGKFSGTLTADLDELNTI